jgi:hypothetical protein
LAATKRVCSPLEAARPLIVRVKVSKHWRSSIPPKPDAATVARDEQTLEWIEQQTLARHHADEDAYLMQCGCGLEAGEDVEGDGP